MHIHRAIVRTPCPEMIYGLTTVQLGKPNYARALEQHARYIAALESLGVTVEVLPPDHNFPDSTFVEDTALLTPHAAVITRPGAPSRRGETPAMEKVLANYFQQIYFIEEPGTLEAGDILQVESHFYIGISQRTNISGAEQMIRILNNLGYSASTIPLRELLHLKSGVAYLGNKYLVVAGELIHCPEFIDFHQIKIPLAESYAAICLAVNGSILLAAGFPRTYQEVKELGYPIIELDMSEFRKIDGGLSCLSLRF